MDARIVQRDEFVFNNLLELPFELARTCLIECLAWPKNMNQEAALFPLSTFDEYPKLNVKTGIFTLSFDTKRD
jgi:hypothetical protein